MIPSPADLSYFIEIAQTLNVSRAAQRLGISQPSLSLAVQRLEHSAGTPLFVRSKKGVTLTPAGRQLLAHARELMQGWDTIKTSVQASVNAVQGSYTIGCHPSVGLTTLPLFMPDLIAKNPNLDIQLKHDLSRKITEDVISLKVDIGIVVNPLRHPDLVIIPLRKDQVTLWSATGKKSDVLLCDPDLVQVQFLIKQFRKEGFECTRTVHCSSLENIVAMVAAGAGMGILPACVVGASGKKLTRVTGAPVFQDEHVLIYRVENKNIRAVQVITQAIKDAF